ncbi:MAG: hypothetical protein J7484_01775 [Microbacterium sp.]|nr:hypothetical protein [Microbacterium sp.]
MSHTAPMLNASSVADPTVVRSGGIRPSILVRRLLLIAAPVLAGIFAIIGTAADPAAGISGTEMWKILAENPDPLQWKSFGLHWSYTFWALPALGAWGFIRGRGAWLANVAGFFGIMGVAMLPGMLIVDFYDSAIGQVGGVETVGAVYKAFDTMWAVPAMVLPGNVSLLVSLPLAAAAFWRAGLAGWMGFTAVILGSVALWFSGFLWWGAAAFTVAAILLSIDLARGLRRVDRAGAPAA